MKKFELASEYTLPEKERSFIRAISQDPELYWELDLPASAFAEHREAYEALSAAIEGKETLPDVPESWGSADDPAAIADDLTDLWQRRRLAELQEDLSARMNADGETAAGILEDLEEQAATIRGELQAGEAGALQYTEDLIPEMLQDVKEAREHVQAGGDGITGVRSGLSRLDEILGGFQPGLTILSGGPGTGKTTLALQLGADAAADGTPVLYVTFENSPKQLMLKGTASCGSLNSRDVRRGRVPLPDVRKAAKRWKEKSRRLALIEGHSELTRGQIRGKARRLMNGFGAERCLVIVDYLQLYAKAADDLRGLSSLRERVEDMGNQLRDLGMRLRSPVLALASQHRGANYAQSGSSNLDTLKESGDLEYSADAVAFLTPAEDRMATDPARALNLTVAKNRHGETGRVELIFRPDLGTMRPESHHAESAAARSNGRAPNRGSESPF
jgi:replicative DNA helicase